MKKFSLDNTFKPFHKVSKGNGRRLAIGDIHGHYFTFKALLDKIGLNKQDQLFLLGDYIDRGKQGKEVLDFIIELIDNGYHIFPLRGNHEEMLLQSHKQNYDNAFLQLPVLKKSKGIRDDKRKIYPKYLRLLEKLPFYYELDDFYLVHAGFDFFAPNPFENYKQMIWIKDFKVNKKQTKGKTIIHGHHTLGLPTIINNIKQKSIKTGIDNGVYSKKNNYGNLICLNLDTYKLTVQKHK